MICARCGQTFNPAEEARLGEFDGDAAQVQTNCPCCHKGYYTFTPTQWAQEEHAQMLIEDYKKRHKRGGAP